MTISTIGWHRKNDDFGGQPLRLQGVNQGSVRRTQDGLASSIGHVPAMCSRADSGEVRKPIGPYREAAVALIFENERVVYDSDEDLLRFFAAEGVCLIPCGISKAALAVL